MGAPPPVRSRLPATLCTTQEARLRPRRPEAPSPSPTRRRQQSRPPAPRTSRLVAATSASVPHLLHRCSLSVVEILLSVLEATGSSGRERQQIPAWTLVEAVRSSASRPTVISS